MSKNLGMEIIAERIETKEQLAYLKQIGCSNVQGYLISKAVHPEQFSAFVQKNFKNKLFN